MSDDFKVKSLAKAVRLLECFSLERPELSIKELSEMLDIQKSTAHNIADTFKRLGYLSQNPETNKYFLGVGLLQFGYIINNHLGFRNFFLPFMEKISSLTNEVVFLGIPHDGEVLYLECHFPTGSRSTRNILGEHAPMHCTGLGKAMLAFMSEQERNKYASGKLKKFTERTITDKDVFLKELELVRTRGYALDNMEHEHGVTCVAFPVFGANHQIVAALSTSAPSLRLDEDAILRVAEIMSTSLKPAQYIL
ncbi:MAG: IclR family transcriptional regulator [Defluviitaleaceae bacterium]|nr:IclR family transcriptional regulator [Defluviitaleaceae bacterium]